MFDVLGSKNEWRWCWCGQPLAVSCYLSLCTMWPSGNNFSAKQGPRIVKLVLFGTGALVLVVMAKDSCYKCHGFESQHRILDGHFSYLFVLKIVIFAWENENKRKSWPGWPIFYNKILFVMLQSKRSENYLPAIRTKIGHQRLTLKQFAVETLQFYIESRLGHLSLSKNSYMHVTVMVTICNQWCR